MKQTLTKLKGKENETIPGDSKTLLPVTNRIPKRQQGRTRKIPHHRLAPYNTQGTTYRRVAQYRFCSGTHQTLFKTEQYRSHIFKN